MPGFWWLQNSSNIRIVNTINLQSNQSVLFWFIQKVSGGFREKNKKKKQKISEAKTRGCFHRTAKINDSSFHPIWICEQKAASQEKVEICRFCISCTLTLYSVINTHSSIKVFFYQNQIIRTCRPQWNIAFQVTLALLLLYCTIFFDTLLLWQTSRHTYVLALVSLEKGRW